MCVVVATQAMMRARAIKCTKQKLVAHPCRSSTGAGFLWDSSSKELGGKEEV